jgi:hypothetical protein
MYTTHSKQSMHMLRINQLTLSFKRIVRSWSNLNLTSTINFRTCRRRSSILKIIREKIWLWNRRSRKFKTTSLNYRTKSRILTTSCKSISSSGKLAFFIIFLISSRNKQSSLTNQFHKIIFPNYLTHRTPEAQSAIM